MNRRLIPALALMVAACGHDHAATAQGRSALELSAPTQFSMRQRSTQSLPGSGDSVLITIGDITAGQVMTTLAWRDGASILPTQSLRPHQNLAFLVGAQRYHLELQQLNNRLVGEDHAHFELRSATTPSAVPLQHELSETEKIQALLASLRSLQNAKMIRNGTAHTVDEAITHLLRKWHAVQDEIKTAEDFIVRIGSRSSTTGQAYLIRLPDGTELSSEAWFRQQLQALGP